MTNDEKGTLNRRGFLGVSAGGAALPLVAGAVAASAPAQAQIRRQRRTPAPPSTSR